MNRRTFAAAVAGIPFLGRWLKTEVAGLTEFLCLTCSKSVTETLGEEEPLPICRACLSVERKRLEKEAASLRYDCEMLKGDIWDLKWSMKYPEKGEGDE